ncbi:MAG: transposase [Clostridia bacterium]|nr:transposase [Clostridia bacterium]
MDLPKRKHMRYKNYDYTTDGYYFLTVCVKDRQKILSEIIYDNSENKAIVCLTEIGKIAERYLLNIQELYDDITVEQYVIMPDHIHMFIGISNWNEKTQSISAGGTADGKRANISNIVRAFKILVSKEIGYSVWQKSFFDVIVTNPKWFDNVVEYIEDNPQRWYENKYSIAPPITMWKK